jgi:hypothetical protein
MPLPFTLFIKSVLNVRKLQISPNQIKKVEISEGCVMNGKDEKCLEIFLIQFCI